MQIHGRISKMQAKNEELKTDYDSKKAELQ